MKNIVLFVSLLISSITFAQVTYGVKAGLNVTNIRKIHGDSGSRYGMHFGGFATIPVSDNYQFYLQPEVLYSQQGEKNENEEGTEVYQLDYINVPILFKSYFTEQDTEFFGVIGPSFGFLISDKVDNPLNPRFMNDTYNSFDMGLVLGVGFSYLRTWEFDVRYHYGFSDVVDNDEDNDDINNTSNLNFGVSYRF